MSAPAAASLHVPELGPSLGRLIVPRRASPPWVAVDGVREALATDAMALAGEARRAAAAGDVAGAVAALAAHRWREAWERAVRLAADRVAAAVDGEIERAAWRARMPRRVWRRRRLTASERRAVAVRFALGGEAFAAGLALLERAARDVVARGDEQAMLDWEDAIRLSARRLEAAWLALEDALGAERERWAPEVADTAAWRRPLWPVIVAWLPLAAALLGLGLLLGGYLDAPPWLAALLHF